MLVAWGQVAFADLAMTPVTADKTETHELFQTDAARAYVGQERRLQEIRMGAPTPSIIVEVDAAEPQSLPAS